MGDYSTVSGTARLRVIVIAAAHMPDQMPPHPEVSVYEHKFADVNDMIAERYSMRHAPAPMWDGTVRYTFFDPIDRLLPTNEKRRGICLMNNEIKVDGSCYCGDVTINGTVSTDKVMACHCKDCQKFSGAPFRVVAVMSPEQITICGEVREYLKIADSGNEKVQGFCGNCGSQIFAADPAKTLYMVRTGCLSQHDKLVPAKHIFGKSAASWLSSIENQQWVTEGPTSAEMAPPIIK